MHPGLLPHDVSKVDSRVDSEQVAATLNVGCDTVLSPLAAIIRSIFDPSPQANFLLTSINNANPERFLQIDDLQRIAGDAAARLLDHLKVLSRLISDRDEGRDD
jgi:hypothetical protein